MAFGPKNLYLHYVGCLFISKLFHECTTVCTGFFLVASYAVYTVLSFHANDQTASRRRLVSGARSRISASHEIRSTWRHLTVPKAGKFQLNLGFEYSYFWMRHSRWGPESSFYHPDTTTGNETLTRKASYSIYHDFRNKFSSSQSCLYYPREFPFSWTSNSPTTSIFHQAPSKLGLHSSIKHLSQTSNNH